MEELKFKNNECYISKNNTTNTNNKECFIYVCNECHYMCILDNLDKFEDTVADHCFKTQHTMKRIW